MCNRHYQEIPFDTKTKMCAAIQLSNNVHRLLAGGVYIPVLSSYMMDSVIKLAPYYRFIQLVMCGFVQQPVLRITRRELSTCIQ